MTSPHVSPRTGGLPRFGESVLASGLVDATQLESAERDLARSIDRRSATPATWDAAVAELLVSQGILTRFQARELLAGRRRFRLGQYTVLDELGRGGMGQVFRAEHAMMGREVAIKVLPRAKATPESEAAFRREMRMLGRLDHPNLVRAFDGGYDAMVYYLVTELVPGLDLRRQVSRHGPLDTAAAASIITQAARGLGYAHRQGLVHRDVKPGNILVTPEGIAKVLDLGLAGSTLEEESARLGRVVGTMDFIAPEQIRAADTVGPEADIYALGCTLYFALTGQPPFPGGDRKSKMQRHLRDTPDAVEVHAPKTAPGLARLVDALLSKSPADRPASADAVVECLRPWTPDVPPAMPRVPRVNPPDPSHGDSGSTGTAARPGTAVWQRGTDEPPPVPPASGQRGDSEGLAGPRWWQLLRAVQRVVRTALARGDSAGGNGPDR